MEREIFTSIIRVEHLYKSFNGEPVLQDISFTLAPGENLIILGKSGAGKSVLLKCITGLLEPDSGKRVLFNQLLDELDEDSLNVLKKRIGFVFQGSALYDSMSLRENLMFHLNRSSIRFTARDKDARVEEILDKLGLLNAIDKMPAELSGGMRKRAGLARALVLRPEIILYDEPTTGLDPATSREISELILRIQRIYQTSSVIVTHDMSCARATSNRMLILEKGSFIAEGTYANLRDNPVKAVQDFFIN
ncbi:MAG: ATP-binding cassette domain-containing protein [Bacteroidales bacterium]|nr:ATP-binding cassette domain-containing protein [Bacteroidales bacterium]